MMAVTSPAAIHVAILETVSEKGAIGHSEKMFLTDELRKQAKAVLPEYLGFVIMTRENINAMLPPGKSIAESEGGSLVETGRGIAADYVAQARIGKFGKQITLTMELYETASNKLVGSFTARKFNAEGLLKEVKRTAGSIFQKITEMIIPLTTESDYRASGLKSCVVHVESTPAGAVFRTDGRLNLSCNKTPCDMTITAGKHLFSFSMDMYFDEEETIDVQRNEQKISVELKPNFGELVMNPVFDEGMGNLDESEINVDGVKMQGNSFRLSAGNHKIQVSHRCYESATFNVNIKTGSKIIFDQKVLPLTGNLEMDVMADGMSKVLPVYVNGKKAGETPFIKTLPICAKVQVGNDRDDVFIKLKAGKTVKYTYKGSQVLLDERDKNKYRTVKIGNQTWMAENLNYKSEGSSCYKNDESNCAKYGRLYSWNEAIKVCPNGWHLPSEKEFETLIDAAGGVNVAGKNLKSASGWQGGNEENDVLGFSVLPAGYRDFEGKFRLQGMLARFWGATELPRNGVSYIVFYADEDEGKKSVTIKDDSQFSVRCLKDSPKILIFQNSAF